MKRILGGTIAILLAVGAVTVWQSFYVLPEYEHAVVLQFGDPVGGAAVTEAGLHFKKPFVQEVRRFDARVHRWDGDRAQIITRERKYIWIDTTARWRITDALKFMTSVRDMAGAQERLDDILDGTILDNLAKHSLLELVREDNRIAEIAGEGEERLRELGVDVETDVLTERIETGRAAILQQVLDGARPKVAEYGIELVDVRIKRINYTQEVQARVFERMESERRRIAELYRSEGRAISREWEGKLDREKRTIESTAYREAQSIIAEADAVAAQTFLDAYNADPEFYAFLRSLEAARVLVGDNHTLVVRPDSPLYRHLTDPDLEGRPAGGSGD